MPVFTVYPDKMKKLLDFSHYYGIKLPEVLFLIFSACGKTQVSKQ